MIKDVMVRLDGTPADDVRLAAVGQIAEIFDSHITGLLFNALPPLVPDGFNGAGANEVTTLLDAARQAGDAIEATVFQRLAELPHPANLRRFDVVETEPCSIWSTAETWQRTPSAYAPSPRIAHQRRPSAGAETKPSSTTPSRSSASKVAQIGTPRT